MAETQESAKVRRFRTSMAKALGGYRIDMLNQSFVEQETTEALAALQRLTGYEQYLGQARIQKVRVKTTSFAFESEAVDQANRARRDCDIVVQKTLRVAQHLRLSGYLDDGLSAFAAGLEKSGPLTVGQLVASVRNNRHATSVLSGAGITSTNIKRIWDTLSEQPHEVSLVSGRLQVKTTSGLVTTLRLPDYNQQPSIADILHAQQFDASVNSISRSEGSLIDFVTPVGNDSSEEPWRIEDLLLAVAVAAQSDMARHARQIEQIGLAVYRGKDPGEYVLIWLAALLLGAILTAACCTGDGPGSRRPFGAKDVCCIAGIVLLLIGGFPLLVILANSNGKPGTTVTTYGNPDDGDDSQ